uniref:Calcineurin-like phosphoesterase domain-containing protein n=1 Tax=Ditylum brightwellii TaxID=49249 RepID=A0A7S1VZG9_9STRA|mmetsp:Transcript_11471/g.17096  ORF Transcript_11471/g.17096 Transcript_11471/m.17096 type:complete len:605 (+) Transcript_11471:80-1894(+)
MAIILSRCDNIFFWGVVLFLASLPSGGISFHFAKHQLVTARRRSRNHFSRSCKRTATPFMTQQHAHIAKPTKNNDSSSSFRLGYVTDVEGNLDYFLNYVKQSQVLIIQTMTRDEANNILSFTLSLASEKKEDCYFVYGGDAVDKGPGDIRLVRALVDLKRRYPQRVFLLVGNRDLNKLRLTAELSQEDMNREVKDIPQPHWDPKAPSLKEYLENIVQQKQQKDKDNTATTPSFSSSVDALNTRVHRLNYMLQHTLGCPNTFEYRRQELAILRNKGKKEITDDEVVDNFLSEIGERGSLFQYLQCANVAVVIGNTLFCHGAVDQNTMKFVPHLQNTKFENPMSKPPPAKLADTVEEWVASLNDFLREGLQDYVKRPHWNGERTSRGGESLMALQNRSAMWGRSIVSNCYGDGGCITTIHATKLRNDPKRLEMERINPLVFEKVSSDPKDPIVSKWLSNCGIQRVIVGHKPTGDCPAVLSSSYSGVEIVSGDTSFSDVSAPDKRGLAVGIVEVVGFSSVDNQLHLRGTLSNGNSYNSKFYRLHSGNKVDESTGDPFLGRHIQPDDDGDDDWWIKVKTEDGHYCLTRGKGRFVEYRHIEKSELLNRF